MFEKLKQRWKVNNLNLVLVIITFAAGGSLCGYTGRKILQYIGMDKGVLWVITYIILITLLWPLCVLVISIPLGQFSFFRKYIIKVWRKLSGITKAPQKTIVIFASGTGTNAKKIIQEANDDYKVILLLCNKPGAAVIKIAEEGGIPVQMIEKDRFYNGDHYLPQLQETGADLLVLAGFLWKIPTTLIQAWPDQIVNIHPALLPKYGGAGMYGNKVHEQVLANIEKESGISIHYVDDIYDHGKIIFQARCPVLENDTAATLAERVHQLEHLHYPDIIKKLLKK